MGRSTYRSNDYGRTFLFDGTPVVEDVIDLDGDGSKSCTPVPNDCEWRRVVVVQQGFGGPRPWLSTLQTLRTRLSLSMLTSQTFTAVGYTVGRPVVANIYDKSDSRPIDHSRILGSGRAVGYQGPMTITSRTEANLYMGNGR